MKIVVLVKEVPDTYGNRTLNLETGLAERDAGENVLDEIGERSIEVALNYADANPGTQVILASMAPESAMATVRKGLAMGAHSAVQVVDEALLGADLGLTAEVLAAAVKRTGFDLVIAGNLSTDGLGGVIPAMIAELLDVPHLTELSSLQISGDSVSGTRVADSATLTVSAALPAVVSVTEALPDARFPSLKGIRAAKTMPFETLSLLDIGIDPDDPAAARSIMTAVSVRPERSAGVKITDEGDAGYELAEFLIANRLA